jgi:hypothetical protein
MTPDELAFEAQNILENQAFQKAMLDIREGFVRQLESVPVGDKELQHELILMIQLLKQVQVQLNRYMQDGKFSEYRRNQESFISRMRERLT